MQFLAQIDTGATLFLAGLIPPDLPFPEWFLSFISAPGGSVFLWGIPAAFAAFRGKHTKTVRFFLLIITALAIAAFLNGLIKNIFMRDRPYSALGMDTLGCGDIYSFPSGHAAVSFAAAVLLSRFDKKNRPWYFFLAILISYSRIYLYCHYLSDVIAGAFFGIVFARLFLTVYFYSRSSGKEKKQS